MCRCLEDFCFAKKVFLAMIFVAIITTAVACAWLSTLKIRLDHFEEEYARLKEIRNTMLVARIPFALFGLFVGFVFYTCMKKLGEYTDVSRLRDGAIIGYVSLIFDFIGEFVNIFALIALVPTFIAVVMLYSGLGMAENRVLANPKMFFGVEEPRRESESGGPSSGTQSL